MQTIDIEAFAALFAPFGGTASDYLRRHFPRYIATRNRLLAQRHHDDGIRLLDVGAHWLHQSLLYALDGYAVSALDVPATVDTPEVRALAAAYRIELLRNVDLEHPAALGELPDNSFDLILFSEVIEHIAFNPIAMWRAIYRVLRPGGRIVVTTPNYYALRGLIRRMERFVHGRGGGVAARSILHEPTFAHHWKEYSRAELLDYFRTLSEDFVCQRAMYVEEYRDTRHWSIARKLVVWLEHLIPFLRPELYLEIELVHKDHGISIEPHW